MVFQKPIPNGYSIFSATALCCCIEQYGLIPANPILLLMDE